MSKGGAGKVYFVLYLAVILELLIIIVERDEAEEHLIAKQKESMRIVESILSQLQVGAGTEGIGTRPQDQITIPPPGINVKEAIGADLKPERRYLIEVGVTDVVGALKANEAEEPEDYLDRLKRFVRLSNVSDLRYEILHSSASSDEAVPAEEQFNKKAESELVLNIGEMERRLEELFNKYKGDQKALIENLRTFLVDAQYNLPAGSGFRPSSAKEPEFLYNQLETAGLLDKASKKRVFAVNFEPKEEGWYKLRFTSRTNKVLGVYNPAGSQVDVDPESKVNIGTVQLKVKDLYKVRDELQKNVNGLPIPELAAKPNEFDAALKKMREESNDPDERQKIELYGYIVKLITPGASESFDQNKGGIEYNIRVVKPQPQIADPKIANLRNVVRVFSKLSALKLPFETTPANGQTVITQNPGNATISGGSGTASTSSGGATKWVSKDLNIQVAGNLQPREEPYVFELVQKNSNKTSDPVQCSVYVYDAKISNETEVASALEASWGDALELVVQPSSGSTIKAEEFVLQFNMGGGSQVQPIRKLTVGSGDNIIVPPGTDKVSLTVGWKDPVSGEIVEIYSGSGEVGLKKPTIITTDMRSEPITDNTAGEFKVRGIMIRPPAISETDKADIGSVNVTVNNATVRDMKTGQTLKVVAVGSPRKVSGQEYEVTLKVTGGKLTKGNVKGNASITVSATARAQGSESKPRAATKTITVNN
jgi:hypothetical protein